MFDVVVAGGGPAGLCCAQAAAAGGARVVVCEREAAFGVPTRTSGGSFIPPLRALGVPERFWNEIHRVRLIGPGAAVDRALSPHSACVLDVRGLYQWLAERAAAAGAQLRLRTAVLGAERDGPRLLVGARDGGGRSVLATRFAVDASGTGAVLAAPGGQPPPGRRRALGVELDLAAPAYPLDTACLIVGERVAPAGYGWAFPHRPGRVRLGVGVIQPDTAADPRPHLHRLLELPALRESLAGAQPIEYHAGLMPVAPLRGRLVDRGLVWVGDAAACGSTLLGEGIRYAMAAGAAAGRALAASVRAGGDEVPLRRFERSWRARHAGDSAIAYRINRGLTRFDDRRWDRALVTLGRTPTWFLLQVFQTRFRLGDAVRLTLTHPDLARRFLRAAL